MIKCKNARRYKGEKQPKCNNGDPCDMCLMKYDFTQRIKILESKIAEIDHRQSPHYLAGYID